MFALVLFDFQQKELVSIAEFQLLITAIDRTTQPTSGVQKIFGSAWLLDLDEGVSFLNQLINLGKDKHLPCKVAFFEKRPQFST